MRATDGNSKPLVGETVVFVAEDGAGTFSNNSRFQKILTDEDGKDAT